MYYADCTIYNVYIYIYVITIFIYVFIDNIYIFMYNDYRKLRKAKHRRQPIKELSKALDCKTGAEHQQNRREKHYDIFRVS